jgi:hypothetical protein
MKLSNPSEWNTVKKVTAGVLGFVALAGMVALLVAAFYPENSATAKSNFCNSLNELSATVMNYEGMNVRTATNDELEAAGNDIADAYDQVVQDAEDWANAYDNPLAEAYDDLYYAIQDLDGGNTIAQDIEDLQPELSAFPQAFQETFDGSGCSSV